MRRFLRFWILIMCALWSLDLHAGEFHVGAHTASYAGFAAGGFGWGSSNDFVDYDVESLLGFTPAIVGGESIWSLALRARVSPNKWPVYIGVGLILTDDEDTFLVLPKKYPRKYYPASGMHWTAQLGFEYRIDQFGLYSEVATFDSYARYRMENSREISMSDIISLGFGIRYYVD